MGKFVRTDTEVLSWADDDGVTHEAERIQTSVIRRPLKEANFIKVYYDTFLSAIGKNSNLMSDFLICIGKQMALSPTGEYQIVNLNKYNKEVIAAELDKSLATVERMITECVKSQILARVGSGRSATYAVSPFILSKSRSTEIEGLQISYNARLHEMSMSAPKAPLVDRMERRGYQLIEEASGDER